MNQNSRQWSDKQFQSSRLLHQSNVNIDNELLKISMKALKLMLSKNSPGPILEWKRDRATIITSNCLQWWKVKYCMGKNPCLDRAKSSIIATNRLLSRFKIDQDCIHSGTCWFQSASWNVLPPFLLTSLSLLVSHTLLTIKVMKGPSM